MASRGIGGGLLTLVAGAIDAIGLRRSGLGRRLIAGLNVLGERGARMIYLRRNAPLLVDGHKMFLSGDHAPSLGFVSSMVHGNYELEFKELFGSLLREGMTVYDVGAHVGHYTLMAARIVGPTGHVYAFEAEPENFQLLQRNVALNGYQNVTCVPKAVSDRSGTLEFYVSRQGNDRHTLVADPRAMALSDKCTVPAVSLDEFTASIGWPRVDVIKMDIEGAEPQAVRGMVQLFARSQALCYLLEFAPEILRAGGADPADFVATLRSSGFAITPVERDLARDAFAPANLAASLLEVEKRGAINLLCRKGSAAEQD